MFPLIAIGAALLGGVAAAESISPANSSSRSNSGRAPSDGDPEAISPQSYAVTPNSLESGSGRRPSALEAVQNFIV